MKLCKLHIMIINSTPTQYTLSARFRACIQIACAKSVTWMYPPY